MGTAKVVEDVKNLLQMQLGTCAVMVLLLFNLY